MRKENGTRDQNQAAISLKHAPFVSSAIGGPTSVPADWPAECSPLAETPDAEIYVVSPALLDPTLLPPPPTPFAPLAEKQELLLY